MCGIELHLREINLHSLGMGVRVGEKDSEGFSRQECWSELPCSPPGDLPNPGI